jgi:hypothetical protein
MLGVLTTRLARHVRDVTQHACVSRRVKGTRIGVEKVILADEALRAVQHRMQQARGPHTSAGAPEVESTPRPQATGMHKHITITAVEGPCSGWSCFTNNKTSGASYMEYMGQWGPAHGLGWVCGYGWREVQLSSSGLLVTQRASQVGRSRNAPPSSPTTIKAATSHIRACLSGHLASKLFYTSNASVTAGAPAHPLHDHASSSHAPLRRLASIGNGLHVRPSTIAGAGLGLFATRGFQRHQIITWYDGEVVTRQVAYQRKSMGAGTHICYKNGTYIDGTKVPARGCGGASFVNHHRQVVNCTFGPPVPGRTPKQLELGNSIVLYALREIMPGEELLTYYSDAFDKVIQEG